ncbi:hypothetical protein DFH09DRAFT_1214663 [Mycena vulgaris]|nr:hypothetical protein DFH09DRAFT_1214663 [Mycena vulgaris]
MNLCSEDYLPVFLQITSAFPKVRLLTAYSLQFNAEGTDSITNWLDSMPLLAYLRVADATSQFFKAFFRTAEDSDPVAPHLAVVDFLSVDPAVLLGWVKERHRLGTPIREIYVSKELHGRLDAEQVKELTGLCALMQLPRGATTPEEVALSL